MSLTAEATQSIIKKFAQSKGDTASVHVQVALLTERLKFLNSHFETHKKDHHSRRGLLKLVGRRRKLLRYLESRNPKAYEKLIKDLGIRK